MSSLRERVVRRNKLFYASRLGPPLSRWRRGSVVMIHIGRSGSSVLSGLMRQHPQVFWDGEIYQKQLNAHGFALGESAGLSDASLPPIDLTDYVRRSGPLFYGFEVKFFHLDLFGVSYEDFVASLQPAGITHVVILERRNYLAKIVSSVRAQADGLYHVPAQNPGVKDRPPAFIGDGVSIDYSSGSVVDYLERYTQSFATMRSALRNTELPLLELTYEDDVEADPSLAYRRLCDHLAIRQRDPRVKLRRPSPGSLPSAIADIDLVSQQLKDTEFEWMLR